ncbi:hypothetical protein EON65_37885 [archaeon]|nr:MAG: hypothetical protein EON65_37885 [archaeon]
MAFYQCLHNLQCREKLTKRQYAELEELVQDVLLIYENCQLYNMDDSAFSKEARRQKRQLKMFLISHGISSIE